jgi:flagellar biosynthesis protein FlhA
MNDAVALQGVLGRLNIRQMLAPLLIVLILAMMVLPLPPFLLDVFLTINIAISVMVLLGLGGAARGSKRRTVPRR